jgi:hypothetical protein
MVEQPMDADGQTRVGMGEGHRDVPSGLRDHRHPGGHADDFNAWGAKRGAGPRQTGGQYADSEGRPHAISARVWAP